MTENGTLNNNETAFIQSFLTKNILRSSPNVKSNTYQIKAFV